MTMKKPQRGISLVMLCLTAALWLAGCGNWNLFGPSALEEDYGNSAAQNMAQSVLNPRAGLNDTPVAGLPPGAGTNEMDRYNKGFKGEERKPMEMKISY